MVRGDRDRGARRSVRRDLRHRSRRDGRAHSHRRRPGARGRDPVRVDRDGTVEGPPMAHTASATQVHHDAHAHEHHGPQGILKYIWSTDHKMIAMQYLFTGMAMGLIGAYMAYVFRM